MSSESKETTTTDVEKYIDDLIKSNKVVVWSKSYCPYCKKVKKIFKDLNQEYFAVELDKVDNGSDIQSALKKKTGQSTVPSVFVQQDHIGGCSDTEAKLKDGSLKEKLEEEKKDTEDLKVAYWTIRGLGAPLRMICEYVEAKWTPVNYNCTGTQGNWNKDVWFKNAKPAIRAKNPFANLPYLEDGGIVICHSNSCLKYLGKKFNLHGKDAFEEIKVDQCLHQIMDLRNDMCQLFYYSSPDTYDKKKDTFIKEKALPHIQKMEDWLTHNNTIYCSSDTPCVADFHLWELIDQLEIFAKHYNQESILKGRPKLETLYSKIKSLEQLSNYFKSDQYNLPINNKMASFGNMLIK